MKLRIALIWFSCFCRALSNRKKYPFSGLNVSWKDCVFAVLQADSLPICEYPTMIWLLPGACSVSA